MKLFKEKERKYNGDLDFIKNESFWDWVDRSSRIECEKIRDAFEKWFANIPDSNPRKKGLYGEFVKGREKQKKSAANEIMIHELMLNLNWGDVFYEKKTENLTPDIYMNNVKEDKIIYLEVNTPSLLLPYNYNEIDEQYILKLREQFIAAINNKVNTYKNLNKPYIVVSTDVFTDVPSYDSRDILQFLGLHSARIFDPDGQKPSKLTIQSTKESWDPIIYPNIENPFHPHISGLLFTTRLLCSIVQPNSKKGYSSEWHLYDLKNSEIVLLENHNLEQSFILPPSFIAMMNLHEVQNDGSTAAYVGPLYGLLNLAPKWPYE